MTRLCRPCPSPRALYTNQMQGVCATRLGPLKRRAGSNKGHALALLASQFWHRCGSCYRTSCQVHPSQDLFRNAGPDSWPRRMLLRIATAGFQKENPSRWHASRRLVLHKALHLSVPRYDLEPKLHSVESEELAQTAADTGLHEEAGDDESGRFADSADQGIEKPSRD